MTDSYKIQPILVQDILHTMVLSWFQNVIKRLDDKKS
jgi:hypothetical protein